MIRVEGLTFGYLAREPVVRGVDLAIGNGEFVLLVGPSGSGKSTLLRCLNGLIPHYYEGDLTGRVLVGDRDVRHHPPARMLDQVGLVPQSSAGALFTASVEDEIAFGLESLGVPTCDIGARARAAATSVGLEGHLDRAPHTLSGGEKQRLLLASALATRPAVLALDEPLANLDPEMADGLCSMLGRLARAGVTVIVAEHRLGPLLGLVNRLIVLDQGQVVSDCAPTALSTCDLHAHGVNVPLPCRLGQQAHLDPLPLTMEALAGRLPPDVTLPAAPGHRATSRPGDVAAAQLASVTMVANGAPVLQDVSAVVDCGEVVALLGRNGSGKTTFLKHLNGLRQARRGMIQVFGESIAGRTVSDLARSVAFVFQDPNDQFFRPSVREELSIGPRALRIRDQAWLDALVERFGLGPLLDQSPFRLSEGQKKRVTFAAAMAVRPRMVLLDEPTTGQDERFRLALVELVDDLRREGATVLLATHDVELADEAADRWLILDKGRLAAAGRPTEVMRDVGAFRGAGLRPGGLSWAREILALGRDA